MSEGPSSSRLSSLDQFRGYAVAGMLVVNFLGGRESIPAVLSHHNTYCSYADTIMPHFLFAVGFSFRLTFLKRQQRDGFGMAARHAFARNLGLILLGLVVYHLDGRYEHWSDLQKLGAWRVLLAAFQRDPFQTLVHIGLTSLWILPVIGATAPRRWAWMVGSAVLFLVLSRAFYYDWVMKRPGIDGGPLGFLTWTIPALLGASACDIVKRGSRPVGRLLVLGAGFMAVGYGLACLNGPGWAPPPFMPPASPVGFWTMSQRAGSVPYLVFSAGFSAIVYALFIVACDRHGWGLGLFRTFGQNALAVYVLHGMVGSAVKPFVPRDAPLWYTLAGFGVYFLICWIFARHLERHNLILKL